MVYVHKNAPCFFRQGAEKGGVSLKRPKGDIRILFWEAPPIIFSTLCLVLEKWRTKEFAFIAIGSWILFALVAFLFHAFLMKKYADYLESKLASEIERLQRDMGEIESKHKAISQLYEKTASRLEQYTQSMWAMRRVLLVACANTKAQKISILLKTYDKSFSLNAEREDEKC